MIIAAVTLIIAAAVIYGVVNKAGDKTEEPPELLEGESLLEGQNRIFMFEPIEKKDILKIFVHNPSGEYAFIQNTKSGEFGIENYFGTPYNSELFQSLESAARYPMINRRVETEGNDYSEYGLEETEDSVYFEITSTHGDKYRVYIGDQIATGNGYYCKVAGRDAVYIIDSNSINMGIFTLTLYDFVSPILAYPVEEAAAYNVKNFSLQKDGEIVISLRALSDEEREAQASVDLFEMIRPENYTPNSDNISIILKKFCNFAGTKTLVIGQIGKEPISDEILAKYGLAEPKYYIYANYDDVNNFIRVSDKNENGTYYAYSELFNLVAEVDPSMVDFLEWDFIKFVNDRVFQRMINYIDTIRVQADGVDETFKLTGENKELSVELVNHAGRKLGADGVTNFRNLYYKMQGITAEGYAEDTSKADKAMTLTVTTRIGNEYVYEFYNYSSRRCFCTLNGDGEFYCLRDQIEMIIADTQRVINGETVIHEDKG